MKELGISYPALIDPRKPEVVTVYDPNLLAEVETTTRTIIRGDGGAGGGVRGGVRGGSRGGGFRGDDDDDGGGGGFRAPRTGGAQRSYTDQERELAAVKLGQFTFTVQFSWQPTPPSKRLEAKLALEAEQAQEVSEDSETEEAPAVEPAAEEPGSDK